MRWKFNSNIAQEYRCCGFIHVRTATLFIGVFSLAIQMAILSTLMVVWSQEQKFDFPFFHHKEDVSKEVNGFKTTTDDTSPSPLLSLIHTTSYPKNNFFIKKEKASKDEIFSGMLFFTCCTLITIMLIYGTIKNKPGHLTPFMGLQVFDFCVSNLNLVSSFSRNPDMKGWVSHRQGVPFREQLMKMQPDLVALIFVISSITAICFKVYMMGIVWSCYKFLNQQKQQLENRQTQQRYRVTRNSFFDPDFHYNITVLQPSETQVILPPKYEDIESYDLPPPSPSPPIQPENNSTSTPPPSYSLSNQ